MIQLVFNAASAAEALERRPVEVGYSQHEGAERATWDDDKLEVVGGTHPVVHPAAGSHANFFDEALHLGRSASEGVGCDDTTGPTFDVRPEVRTIPSDPAQAREQFPWIEFEGRWGELQRSIFNGPTGPNLKSQWTEPIEWSEGWREPQPRRPRRRRARHGGDRLLLRRSRGGVERAAAGRRRIRCRCSSRSSLSPCCSCSCSRGRRGGPRLRSASPADARGARCSPPPARMYIGRIGLFLGLGLVAVPISVIVTLLQAGLLRGSSFLGIPTEGEGGGIAVYVAVVRRHRALVDRPRARPGGHGTRPRRDRPGPADLGRAGLPAGARLPAPAARCRARRGVRRLAARHDGRPRADRDLARRALGAGCPGRRAGTPRAS